MKSIKIGTTLLALSIGVSLMGCPASQPSATKSPTPTLSTAPTTGTSTAPATQVTPASTTAVTTETKNSLIAMEDDETAINGAENDDSTNASLGIQSIAVTALGDNLPKVGTVAPNLGANLSKINLPRVKRLVTKAELKIRATVKKVQDFIKTNLDHVVSTTVVDNNDGTITETVTRSFKVKTQGASRDVTTARTFTKLDATVVKDNKVTGGVGQPVKFYSKHNLTLPNGTRTSERTITFNYNDDGSLKSRDVVFTSTSTVKGKTQTINMTGSLLADGSETRTGTITLFNGQTLNVNTTIDKDGNVKRTVTGQVIPPAPSSSPGAPSTTPSAALTAQATVTVELDATADGTTTVKTTDSTAAAPKTETVTADAEITAAETALTAAPTVDTTAAAPASPAASTAPAPAAG